MVNVNSVEHNSKFAARVITDVTVNTDNEICGLRKLSFKYSSTN